MMYDNGIDVENIEIVSHEINLRRRGKIKLKTTFSGLTKLHISPRRC